MERLLNCLDILKEEGLKIGVFIATSPDELHRDWIKSTKIKNYNSHLEKKLVNVNRKTPIITIRWTF